MKQTFEFNGDEFEYKSIFCISKILYKEGVNKHYFNIYFKHINYVNSINFDTLKEAEQSRNELIKNWNEVLND